MLPLSILISISIPIFISIYIHIHIQGRYGSWEEHLRLREHAKASPVVRGGSVPMMN